MSAPSRISAQTLHQAITRLSDEIAKRHAKSQGLIFLGIANGGIGLAQRIAARFPKARTGTIDISFHRDDIGSQPIPKELQPSVIPVDVTGATVILIDDVLHTGRTVKAALDELFDHGRPKRVELAVLINRNGRCLPIEANYTGLTLEVPESQKVRVHLSAENPSADHAAITTPSTFQ